MDNKGEIRREMNKTVPRGMTQTKHFSGSISWNYWRY